MADLRLEVDRFDWASEERLEVVGRWHGIRGRVFLRPTLDVRAADGPRRLLAVLEHKPWIAKEGEEWVVAFPWTGPRDLEHADLAVGSEAVVSLPHPGTGGTARPPVAEVSGAVEPTPETVEQESERTPEPVDPAELARTRAQLEQVRAERDTTAGARDAAQEQWRKAQAELEEMRAAVTAQLAAADQRRRGAEQARDEAVAATDQARGELRRVQAEHDFARQQLEGAERGREEAVGGREEAARELHRASSSRSASEAERDEIRHQAKAAPVPGPVVQPAVVRAAPRRHQGLRVLAAGALVALVLVIVALILTSL